MESMEQRATVASQGVRSEFWEKLILPEIAKMCKTKGRSLIMGSADDDDIKRGWVQALEWLMNLPGSIVDDYAIMEEKARVADAEVREDEYRAEHGFRSPIRMAPEPGELKQDSDGE